MLKRKIAIGFRVHSGWAAMVALAGPSDAPLIVKRCRIDLADRTAGPVQPYHAAESMNVDEADTFLKHYFTCSIAVAAPSLRNAIEGLHPILGATVLNASGRPLPDLKSILASHALIHTAEGEFYRNVIREACALCSIKEKSIREKDLPQLTIPKPVGAPWQQDQKLAATAALILLG